MTRDQRYFFFPFLKKFDDVLPFVL